MHMISFLQAKKIQLKGKKEGNINLDNLDILFYFEHCNPVMVCLLQYKEAEVISTSLESAWVLPT